jgi:hypothetical protein
MVSIACGTFAAALGTIREARALTCLSKLVCYLHVSVGHFLSVLSLRPALAQAWLSSDESRCYGLRPMGCKR